MDLNCTFSYLSCTAAAIAFVAVVTFFLITALITGITRLSNAVTVAVQASYDYGFVQFVVVDSGDFTIPPSVGLTNNTYTAVHMPSAPAGGGYTTNPSKFNVTTTGALQGIIEYTPAPPIVSPSVHGIRGVITFNINLSSIPNARVNIFYAAGVAVGAAPPSSGFPIHLLTMSANLQAFGGGGATGGTNFQLSCPFRVDLDITGFAGQKLTFFPIINVSPHDGSPLTVITMRCYAINTIIEEVPRLVKYVGP